MRTYVLYTDDPDPGEAKVYIESQAHAGTLLPREGDHVMVDGVGYRVVEVSWDVYSKPSSPTDPTHLPQQMVTVMLLKEPTRARRSGKV
jgi:hypothetical protein